MNGYIRGLLDGIGANPYLFNFLQRVCNLGDLRCHVEAMLDASCEDSLLDVGCGTGLYSTLAKGRYLGIDLNGSYIRYATRRYGDRQKSFLAGDITRLDTQGEQFDNTLYLAMLHHFSAEENIRILEKVSLITKKKILILDLTVPEKPNFFQDFFLRVERGKYVRPLSEQLKIIEKVLNVKDVKMVLNRSKFGLFSIITSYPRG